MKKRVIVLIASGAALLGVTAVVLSAIIRRAQPDFSPIYSSDGRSYPEEKGPRVLLGYDGPYWKVAEAIRIDVRRGIPHTRVDEAPIENVASYVAAQLEKNASAWIVITASTDEKLGDVIRVIDACRTTRVRGIVLNQFPLKTLP
jgi:hypothetical protein